MSEAERRPGRRSNRAFWAFFGTLAVASVALVALIVINRPLVVHGQESVARANLRAALDAAQGIARTSGTLDAAEPRAIAEVVDDVLFIDPDQSSNEPDIVSVYATDGLWAAAAKPTASACQWIRVDAAGAVATGTGTDCSAETVATAPADGWPDA